MAKNRKRFTPRALAATVLAATGLASLSPVQQAGLGLAVGFAVWSGPAVAQNTVPGVGIVVKKKPGNANLIIPSGEDGSITLSGLEAGAYEISLAGNARTLSLEVPSSGLIAFRAVENKGRRWIEQIRAYPERAIDVQRSFEPSPPVPCARPQPGMPSACPGRIRSYIDVNASDAREIVRLAPRTTPAAAEAIVAERRNGDYKDVKDFAARVCSKVSVDFGTANALFGNTRVIGRADFPKAISFQCSSSTQLRRGPVRVRSAIKPEFAVFDWKCLWIDGACLLI